MSMVRRLTVASAATAGLLLFAAGAQAAGSTHPVAPAPKPSTPAAGAPSAIPGRMTLTLLRAMGRPPFALIGAHVVVRGVVWPYVGGEQVKVSVYRDGRKVAVKRLALSAIGNGAGQFRLSYSTGRPGLVQARAVHYGTPALAQFTARSLAVHFVRANLSGGAQGGSVSLLQSELNALHYVVPLSGTFDEGTARAVVAYRKMTGLDRVATTNSRVFTLLGRGAGAFHVRYRGDGRHVEANLTRQLLAEIDPGGRVHAIYQISSGKPSTPTVIGRFRVYEKSPGYNAKGMLDSNYFIRGYAIHGYAEVPTYPASHGCLRVPIPNAASIFAWTRVGTPVDVYNESGGGSHHVSSHAGP